MTEHTTRTCNGCGIELKDGHWLTATLDYFWSPMVPSPADDPLPNISAAGLLRAEEIGKSHWRLIGALSGRLNGHYCSWACLRAMLDYIEKHDRRDYLRKQ